MVTTSDLNSSGDFEGIRHRYQHVLHTIDRAARMVHRDPTSVRLIVVSKSVSLTLVDHVRHYGARTFGESRLQEALPKVAAFKQHLPPIAWHFIGRLQRRKVKSVVGIFEMIHSVDSIELGEEIDRRARECGVPQKVLLEINQGGEFSKGGFAPDGLQGVLPQFDDMEFLQVEGMMTIPPHSENREDARPYFSQLRALAERVGRGDWKRIRMRELSMGMSQDYDIAIQEGATMVRVGTEIFGTRHG